MSLTAPVPARSAFVLGLLQGPSELLPVSSSGHLTLIPWLLGRPRACDPAHEKALDAVLHAGSAAVLLVLMRQELRAAGSELGGGRAHLLLLACAPAALVGSVGGAAVARRLGSPGVVAAGMLAGGIGLAAADLRGETRSVHDAGTADFAWLGLAQAAALVPGISRNGATLTVGRWRGFSRPAASRLSWQVALPVLCGAAAFEAQRVARNGGMPIRALLAGAGGAGLSTLVAGRLGLAKLAERGLRPVALYRCALGSIALARLRRR
jgi:undecaprenyl-diphosphatase